MPPSKFYFDETCPLCRSWVSRWRRLVGDYVVFIPFDHPEQKTSTEFVDVDGKISVGAESVARMLATVPSHAWVLVLYQRHACVAWFAEHLYRLVSFCRHCRDQVRPYLIMIGVLVMITILLAVLAHRGMI